VTPPGDLPGQRFDKRPQLADYGAADALAVCGELFPGQALAEPAFLEGGFSNANFRVDVGPQAVVVRFYPGGPEIARREASLLKLLVSREILVPALLGECIRSGGKIANVVAFARGPSLADLLAARPHASLAGAFRAVGAQLARIHRVSFDQAGPLGSDGRVARGFGDFYDAGEAFIREPLRGRAGARLGPALTERVLRLVARDWRLVREARGGPVLVHCDFNPKNLIVHQGAGTVTVLDWEFAIAGDPLIDLANFLRFEEDYSPFLIDEFLRGYAAAGGALPPNWRPAAWLHDLVSMCALLDRPEELPKTFKTARRVVEDTLRRFQA